MRRSGRVRNRRRTPAGGAPRGLAAPPTRHLRLHQLGGGDAESFAATDVLEPPCAPLRAARSREAVLAAGRRGRGRYLLKGQRQRLVVGALGGYRDPGLEAARHPGRPNVGLEGEGLPTMAAAPRTESPSSPISRPIAESMGASVATSSQPSYAARGPRASAQCPAASAIPSASSSLAATPRPRP